MTSEFSLHNGLYNIAQIILAILGFVGVGWFILGRLFTPDQQKARPVRLARIALFLGLASWLGLVLLRQDIVAATGLVIAMLLFWRYFKAEG
jgi:hypothetical protein